MTNIKTMSETFYGYKMLNVFQCIHLAPFKVMGKWKRKAKHKAQLLLRRDYLYIILY